MPSSSPHEAKIRRRKAPILKALLPRRRHDFDDEAGIDVDQIDDRVVAAVADLILNHQIGILPTETVYGLVGSAQSDDVVERIFQIKGRDVKKPLPVQVSSFRDVADLGVEIGPQAETLESNFWPGPLTLVLPFLGPERCAKQIAPSLLRQWQEKGTVAIRISDHPVTALILRKANIPVVATSANISGQAPITRLAQLDTALRGKVDWIVDAGPAQFSRESSVVQCDREGWRILREGALRGAIIQKTLLSVTSRSFDSGQDGVKLVDKR